MVERSKTSDNPLSKWKLDKGLSLGNFRIYKFNLVDIDNLASDVNFCITFSLNLP